MFDLILKAKFVLIFALALKRLFLYPGRGRLRRLFAVYKRHITVSLFELIHLYRKYVSVLLLGIIFD